MPSPSVSTVHAVILAGGDGSRMFPLCGESSPKALLTVANVPLLHYALDSLSRAGISSATVISSAPHTAAICDAVAAFKPIAGSAKPECAVVERDPAHGTADALRALPAAGGNVHTLVVSSDLVTDLDLSSIFADHFVSGASCTVLLTEARPSLATVTAAGEAAASAKGCKRNVKPVKGALAPESDFKPAIYATIDPSGQRLLGLVGDTDLEDGAALRVRPTLLRRFPSVYMRADLADPHVYLLAPWVVRGLLPARPQISSVRFDLIPYLARRQFTLAAALRSGNRPEACWATSLPACANDDIVLRLSVASFGGFAWRINSAAQFLAIGLDVAAGALSKATPYGKENKKGKPSRTASPFETVGERTNVSSDSLVGAKCTAGDKASVKKSCVGDAVLLGAGVKLNGCVIAGNSTIGNDANLSACVVCSGASIGTGSILKDCRVDAGVSVPQETRATGRDFSDLQDTGVEEGGNGGFDDAFEFS
jgi:translation initiation factor eIF-2B subunit gamma